MDVFSSIPVELALPEQKYKDLCKRLDGLGFASMRAALINNSAKTSVIVAPKT